MKNTTYKKDNYLHSKIDKKGPELLSERDSGIIFNLQKFSIHDGPGIRTVVFFKGCPLRCRWCSNPESQNPKIQIVWDEEIQGEDQKILSIDGIDDSFDADGTVVIDERFVNKYGLSKDKIGTKKFTQEGKRKNVSEIMKVIMQDEVFYEESSGGVTLSGGEPMMQAGFAIALLKKIRSENIHTAAETTGYVKPEIFDEVSKYLDLLLFDMKHWNRDKHLEKTNVSNDLCLQNMKRAIKKGKDVLTRLPIIPDFNNSLKDAEEFSKLLKSIGASKINLLPFHQFGEKKYTNLGLEYEYSEYKALREEDLKDFQNIFLSNGIDAFF